MTDRPTQRTPNLPTSAAPRQARTERQNRANTKLAEIIAEAGFSHAGLARRVNQLGVEHGLDLRYDKTSITRWLRGQQPRGTTPALIAEVFTQRLGRRLAAPDLGLDACAPVYAGLEYAATPEEAVDIVSGLWRKDTGNQAELRKIAFTPAGLVVPSRDWLIGRADERVGQGPQHPVAPVPPVSAEAGPADGDGERAAGAEEPGGGAVAVQGAWAARAARVPTQSRGAREGEPVVLLGGHAGAGTGGGVPGRVGAGDIAAVRAVGDLFRSSTTPTAAGTPGRPSSATWSTRPSRCCAGPTARRSAAGCSPPSPTSPGSPGGPRTTSGRTVSRSATSCSRCGWRRRPGTGSTGATSWSR